MHLPHLPLPGLRASLPVKMFTTRTNPVHRIGSAVNYWHAFKYDQIGRVSRYVVVSNTDDNNSVRGTVREARVTRFRLFTPLRDRESDARNIITHVHRAIRYGRHERPVHTGLRDRRHCRLSVDVSFGPRWVTLSIMDLIIRQLVMRFRQCRRVTLSVVRRLQIGSAYRRRPIETKKKFGKNVNTPHLNKTDRIVKSTFEGRLLHQLSLRIPKWRYKRKRPCGNATLPPPIRL